MHRSPRTSATLALAFVIDASHLRHLGRDGTKGPAAEGRFHAALHRHLCLHYADNLNTPRNNNFRKSFALAYKANADVYAVQGYDAAQILGAGLSAAKGDFSQRDAFTTAMRKTTVDNPRGKFTLSADGNPVQDMYVREVKGLYNESRGVVVKAPADPARGGKL